MPAKSRFLPLLLLLVFIYPTYAQDNESPQLTVKQIMNELITPASNTIWGAYQLQTDEEWATVQKAAEEMLVAGELLGNGGAGEGERELAARAEWRIFTGQMLEATRKVLSAVAARDEEAMSAAGNDDLYPPCESCHERFQTR